MLSCLASILSVAQTTVSLYFELPGGDFNRTAKVTFLAGGEVITISQQVIGQDELGHMKINTKLDGTIPAFPAESRVRISDFKEEYQRVSPGNDYNLIFKIFDLFAPKI